MLIVCALFGLALTGAHCRGPGPGESEILPRPELAAPGASDQPGAQSAGLQNVVLIVLDGVRPAEFFRGIQPFAKQRRAAWQAPRLLPYLRGELSDARQLTRGNTLLYGNRFLQTAQPAADRTSGSGACGLDNNYGVSLPAYGHLLSGARLPDVRDNRFAGQLPGPTVPDRLLADGIAGNAVAVYSAWGPIARVASRDASRAAGTAPFEINTGRQAGNARPRWKDARFDRDLQSALLARLDAADRVPPRYMFAAFNDSDEWAHIGNYSKYIAAIRAQDGYVRSIVQAREAMARPADRGRTLYIVTTDHGRGRGRWWKSHGRIPGSQYIWALLHVPTIVMHSPAADGHTIEASQLAPGVAADLKRVRAQLDRACNHSQLGRIAYSAVSGDWDADDFE